MSLQSWTLPLLCAGVIPAAMTFSLLADEPAEKPETPPAVDATADADPPVEDWASLSARKLEIAKKLQALSIEFKTAAVERKRAIQGEFDALLQQFNTDISPKMAALAPETFAADPQNFEAGEFVLQSAWQENRNEEARTVAEQMLAAGHENKLVLNLAGAANFATHNFARAKELLDKAEKLGQLDFRTGGRFLEEAGPYEELWKQEQEIRAGEDAAEGDQKLPRVELVTSKGRIELVLFENEAPNTVANFVSLVDRGYYDGIKFHRVIPNFMIQGGDELSKDDDPNNDGTGSVGYTIKCECFEDNARKHFAGSLSMAKKSEPHTGGSQFFITHLPTYWLNGDKATQTGHTVFGRVVEGLDVVAKIQAQDTIEKASVLFKRDHEYVPVKTDDPKSPDDLKPKE